MERSRDVRTRRSKLSPAQTPNEYDGIEYAGLPVNPKGPLLSSDESCRLSGPGLVGVFPSAMAEAVGTKTWIIGPGRLALLLGDRTTSMTRTPRVNNARFRASHGTSQAKKLCMSWMSGNTVRPAATVEASSGMHRTKRMMT